MSMIGSGYLEGLDGGQEGASVSEVVEIAESSPTVWKKRAIGSSAVLLKAIRDAKSSAA